MQPEKDVKVGFHQSWSVTSRLGRLQDTLSRKMIINDLHTARNILEEVESAISIKLKPEEFENLDTMKKEIDGLLKSADYDKVRGGTFFFNNVALMNLRSLIIKYDRELKKLQHKYGFYIMEEDDPRKAITKR